jgi:pyrimidine-specific ribonucleoside hydrolase
METSDPDDFLTLLLLLGHPEVELRAVTITPGTKEQVGLVRQALGWFNRRDIRVGAFNIDHDKDCVSAWHYKAYPQLKKVLSDEAEVGWRVLDAVLGPDTTMVCGAALKNLGGLLGQLRLYDRPPNYGRLYIQGGFAGEGVVPPEKQLEKFRGKVTCPTFNLNGDPVSALSVLEHRGWFSDLRFVSKNVCHGVLYDEELHLRYAIASTSWCNHEVCNCECHQPGSYVMHVMECCSPCSRCGQNVPGFMGAAISPTAWSQSLIYQGMGHYLRRHPGGKAFHDPLAACCAIEPEIGEWAEVELYRERGEWGSYLLEGSGVKIIVGYDHEKFVQTLLRNTP